MTQIGSLFTLFLHSPVKGFAYISEATEMAVETWFQTISRVEAIEVAITEALEKNDSIGEILFTDVQIIVLNDLCRMIS
jgi:hypothetical protein